MANNNADIKLLAGLNIDSSETEILKAIKIIEKRLKANHDARFKLNVDIDETVLRNTVDKLQNILKGKELKIDTKASIEAITKEVNAMSDIVTVAKKAAIEKLEFAKANERVRNSADDTADAVNRERNAMDSLSDVESILNGINRCGQDGNSVFQRFGSTLHEAFSTYTTVNLLEEGLNKVVDAGREAIATVKEFDDEATSLRMATGESSVYVNGLMDSYNALGQEIGAITSEVSQSADEWLRQGHTVEDTNTLIQDSMILSKVSNLESEKSTKYLTSAMQGYKVAVEDVIGIVDKLSAVDMVSATDAGGLAEAMSRTAQGAEIAGISMDRLLGMIAATGEVTQKSMSSIGETFKTIFSRMRNIKDGNLSLIGDDGEIEDLSNVEIVLDGLGIKLRDSNLEFRNFQDVLDDVAGSWNSYSSVQ